MSNLRSIDLTLFIMLIVLIYIAHYLGIIAKELAQ